LAVQAIAAQVFDLPVVIPSPGEYVARGAAVQAAWARGGNRPEWPVAVNAAPARDFHPEIASNYKRASTYVDSGT
jgi:xylulokinase